MLRTGKPGAAPPLAESSVRAPGARPGAEPAPPAPEAVGPSVAESRGAGTRLAEIRSLAAACLESCEALSEAGSRLEDAGAAVVGLTGALTSARQDSDLIHENTDKIYEIANNLANSAEQAFNLSHEVETRASAMAGELAASLVETDGLLDESKRISDVLTIMSEISSTTSILSFNASIVAANAGSHGKPFAVVAKEMRKLAESTELSLKDITAIVRTIQGKVSSVTDRIRSINEGVKDEKQSIMAVAGNLQGVMLANEVVRTVSGLCVQKSAEELERFRSIEGKADEARLALEAGSAPDRLGALASGLRKVIDLTGE
jgi:methyl-accepting chemotaxis protein